MFLYLEGVEHVEDDGVGGELQRELRQRGGDGAGDVEVVPATEWDHKLKSKHLLSAQTSSEIKVIRDYDGTF